MEGITGHAESDKHIEVLGWQPFLEPHNNNYDKINELKRFHCHPLTLNHYRFPQCSVSEPPLAIELHM